MSAHVLLGTIGMDAIPLNYTLSPSLPPSLSFRTCFCVKVSAGSTNWLGTFHPLPSSLHRCWPSSPVVSLMTLFNGLLSYPFFFCYSQKGQEVPSPGQEDPLSLTQPPSLFLALELLFLDQILSASLHASLWLPPLGAQSCLCLLCCVTCPGCLSSSTNLSRTLAKMCLLWVGKGLAIILSDFEKLPHFLGVNFWGFAPLICINGGNSCAEIAGSFIHLCSRLPSFYLIILAFELIQNKRILGEGSLPFEANENFQRQKDHAIVSNRRTTF